MKLFKQIAKLGLACRCARAVGDRGARAGAGRGAVLLSGRRRRTDHQDHRRLRRRFRKGKSRRSSCSRSIPAATRTSIAKALTAVKSGDPPVTSILLSTDMYTLIDEDAIVPFDDLIKTADDRAWLKSFYPAFMENSQTGGKTWGIPFQRSTIVLYYNKEAFKEAGLDPEPAAGDVEGDGGLRGRSSPSATRRARSRSGACRFRRRASRTGCSRD